MELALILIQACLALTMAQNLAFPAAEDDIRPGQQPPRLGDARIPIYVLGACPPNQLLYPGDQQHDWVCDCGPGYIYLPSKKGCFLAYRQGPCTVNQYLILPANNVIPECVQNPCRTDGFVRFKNACYELDKSGGPCKPANEGGGVFGVNVTTLELECLKGTDPLSLINFPSNCPPGSRRSASNCRPEY